MIIQQMTHDDLKKTVTSLTTKNLNIYELNEVEIGKWVWLGSLRPARSLRLTDVVNSINIDNYIMFDSEEE